MTGKSTYFRLLRSCVETNEFHDRTYRGHCGLTKSDAPAKPSCFIANRTVGDILNWNELVKSGTFCPGLNMLTLETLCRSVGKEFAFII